MNELEGIWKEAVVVLNVEPLSRHLPGVRKPQDMISCVTTIYHNTKLPGNCNNRRIQVMCFLQIKYYCS
jgi:hypothetical protein